MSHAQGNVDHRLKEIIRILLARFANDKYFAALRSRKARDMGLTEERIDAGCYEYEDDAVHRGGEMRAAIRRSDVSRRDARSTRLSTMNSRSIGTEPQIMELGRLYRVPLRHADVYAVSRSRSAEEPPLGGHTRTRCRCPLLALSGHGDCAAKCPLMTQSGHSTYTEGRPPSLSSEAYLWFDLCRQLQEPSRSAYGSRAHMTPLVQANQQEPRQKN